MISNFVFPEQTNFLIFIIFAMSKQIDGRYNQKVLLFPTYIMYVLSFISSSKSFQVPTQNKIKKQKAFCKFVETFSNKPQNSNHISNV